MTSPPLPALPDRRLATGAARLAARYTGRFPPETVRGPVAGSCRRPAVTARVRTRPVMPAERFADERPEAPARTREVPGSALPRVLFVCGHNAGAVAAGRGPPAHRAAGRVRVPPAGTRPAAEVDPGIVRALREVGADVADAFHEPLTDEVVRAADAVVTTGRGDACPVVPGRRCPDRPVTGPDGVPQAGIRAVRDRPGTHVTDPLTTLTGRRTPFRRRDGRARRRRARLSAMADRRPSRTGPPPPDCCAGEQW